MSVPGRNGSLLIKNGTYPDLKKTFLLTIDLDEESNVEEIISSIENWLFSEQEINSLTYRRSDRYTIVKQVIVDDISMEFETFGDFKVTFICEPFNYDLNENIITLTNETTIYNPGHFPSEPNIKIYGYGDIQLTINSETVQINDVNKYVELDSKLLLCLNSDKTSKTRDMNGNFLLLSQGDNEVSWTGNVTKVEIIPRIIYR